MVQILWGSGSDGEGRIQGPGCEGSRLCECPGDERDPDPIGVQAVRDLIL